MALLSAEHGVGDTPFYPRSYIPRRPAARRPRQRKFCAAHSFYHQRQQQAG